MQNLLLIAQKSNALKQSHISVIQLRIIIMQNTKNKRIIFLLTNLAFQAMVGQISAYSICKAPMAQAFGYDEAFLGIMEAITIIGELIGSIVILFIPLNPATGFLLFSLVNALTGLLLFLPRSITSTELRDFVLVFGFFVQSFCASPLAYTQIIFNHYYDENSEKYEHSIWYSFTFLGDLLSILLVQYVLYTLRVKWEWAKMIWALYMLAVGAVMYFYLDEHSEGQVEIEEILSIEDEEKAQKSQGVEIQKDGQVEVTKITKTQQCFMLFARVWKLLKEPNIFLVTVSFGFTEAIFVNLVYWLPYYYIEVNEQAYSMVGILGCTIFFCIGGLLFEYLLFQILNLEKHSRSIAYSLLISSGLAYSLLWIKRNQDAKVQIILLCISCFLLACPYNRISTLDPLEEAGEDPHRIKTVFLLAHMAQNLVAAIFTLVIGFFMKAQPRNLWHVMMANVMLVIFVQTIRKVCRGNDPKIDKDERLEKIH